MASILEDRTAKTNQAINTTASPLTDAKSTGASAFRRPPPLATMSNAPSAPPAAPATGATSPTQRTTSPVMRHNPYGMPQTSDRATSPTMPPGAVAAGNMSPNNANTYATGFGMVGRSPSPPNATTASGSVVNDSTSNRPYSSAYSRGTSPLHQHGNNTATATHHYGAVHRGSYTDAMQRNINNAANVSNTSFGFSTSSPTNANPQHTASGAQNASHPTNTSATNNVAFTFNSARIASGSVSPLSFAQAAAELNFTEEVDVSQNASTAHPPVGITKQQQNTSTLSDTPSRSSITKVYQNGRPMVRSSNNNSTNTSALSEHHTQLGAAATVIMSADTDEISYAHSNSPAAQQQQPRTTSPLTATTYLHGQQPIHPQLRRSPHAPTNHFVNPNASEASTVAATAPTATVETTSAVAAPLPDLIVVNVAFRRTAQQYIVRRASQLLGITTEPMLTGAHVMVEGDRGIDMGRITGIDCLATKELVAAAASASPAEFNTLMTSQSSTIEQGANGNATNAYNNNSANSRPRPVCRLAKYPFVLRNATQEEVNNYHNVQVLEEARACQYAADQAARNIPEGVDIVDCTFQYDRNKLTLWYVAAERVYFVPLLKVLNQRYRCRIWMERVMPAGSTATSTSPLAAAMPTNHFHNSMSEMPAASPNHYDPHHSSSMTEFAEGHSANAQQTETPSRAYGNNAFGTTNNRRRHHPQNNNYSAEATPSSTITNSYNNTGKSNFVGSSNIKTGNSGAAAPTMDATKKSENATMPYKNTLSAGNNNTRQQQQQHSHQHQNAYTANGNSSRRNPQNNSTHNNANNNGGSSATKKRLTFDD